VAAAQSRDVEVVATVLRTQRVFLLRELHNLESLRSAHSADPVVSLLLAAAVRHISADVALIDDAEERLLADGGAALAAVARAASAEPPAQPAGSPAPRRRTA
ncbi:MAG: hypothetical protein L0Y54_16180, partial [Sporichthyaceae bacterium]|nr:hypothetical protein [Sporichthyaceae bacterium]